MKTLDEFFFNEWKAHHSLGYGEGWQIPEGSCSSCWKQQLWQSLVENLVKKRGSMGLFQTCILTPFLPLARSFVIQFKVCGSVTWQPRKLTGLGVLFQFWLPYDVHFLLTFTSTKENTATPAGSSLGMWTSFHRSTVHGKTKSETTSGWLLNGVIFHL